MYAIRHKKKHKWIYEVRNELSYTNPDRYKLDKIKAKTFMNSIEAKCFMVMNHISLNTYEIVKIKVIEVKDNA